MKTENSENANDIKEVQTILFDQLRKVRDAGSNLEQETKRTQSMLGITHQIIETGKLEFLAQRLSQNPTSRLVPVNNKKLLGDGNP